MTGSLPATGISPDRSTGGGRIRRSTRGRRFQRIVPLVGVLILAAPSLAGETPSLAPDIESGHGDHERAGTVANTNADSVSVDQPRLVPGSKVVPAVPDEAKRRGVSAARVTIMAKIDRRGKVRKPVVLECSSPGLGFEDAARAAVMEWRYLPAVRDGKPVAVYLIISLDIGSQPVEGSGMAEWIHMSGKDGVSSPELLPGSKIAPRYPLIARMNEHEGSVILMAIVEKDGSVSHPVVLMSPGANYGFDEAAIEAVNQWRYRPALLNGKPVRAWFTVVVDFVIRR